MPFDRRLDLVNFPLADVRGGLGPYVGIFLLGTGQWDQAQIGLVLTVSGLIGISLHAPIGAFIDATRQKRALLIGGVWALAAGGWRSPGFPPCRSSWRPTSSWRSWVRCSPRPWPRSR
jgi:hypothetical protein